MQCRAAWRPALTALAVAAAGAACDEPEVGPGGQAASTAPQIAITAASVNGSDQVVASFTVARGGPVDAAEVASLRPSWTLAELSVEPVSGTAAWRSLVLTGAQTAAQLPVAGPGTPPQHVLASARQPGAETGGATADLGRRQLPVHLRRAPAGGMGSRTDLPDRRLARRDVPRRGHLGHLRRRRAPRRRARHAGRL